MSAKRRLAKIEADITQELKAAAAEKYRREMQFCRDFKCPLPPAATDEEKAEALQKLLSLQADVRSGRDTDAGYRAWLAWVDGIHSKYNHTPLV